MDLFAQYDLVKALELTAIVLNAYLVVNDEDSLITILKRNLEFTGYKVKDTNSAIETLLRLEQERHDFIVSDIMIP